MSTDPIFAHWRPQSWETVAREEELAELAGAPAEHRCAHPDCRRPFNPAKPWQHYCSPACRRADQDEARKVGHMIARPALLAREMKHRTDVAGRAQGRAARNYVDRVMSAWRIAREERAKAAEAALAAEAARQAAE